MSELEERLGAVLSNPQLMQQIMTMAQTLGGNQGQPQPEPKQKAPEPPPFPNFDPKLLQAMANIAQKSGMDQNQQALLRALSPYLSHNRVEKLERAMRAARMAGAASVFLNSGGLQLISGR